MGVVDFDEIPPVSAVPAVHDHRARNECRRATVDVSRGPHVAPQLARDPHVSRATEHSTARHATRMDGVCLLVLPGEPAPGATGAITVPERVRLSATVVALW